MKRDQFTFYRSYYEAMKDLSVEECTKLLLAIAAYALDEEEPELSGSCSACFKLIRPTLDSGRNKAANRMNADEQTEIKPKSSGNKAKSNQNKPEQTEIKSEQTGTNRKEREKEKERESEKEKEREYDSSSTPVPPLTDDELREIRQEQAETEKAARRVGLPVSALADQDCMDSLRAEHGANNLLKAIDKLQGAPEKSRNWRYVGGILRKEKAAGYTWAERAAESNGGAAGDAEQVLTRNPFALQSLKCRGSVT